MFNLLSIIETVANGVKAVLADATKILTEVPATEDLATDISGFTLAWDADNTEQRLQLISASVARAITDLRALIPGLVVNSDVIAAAENYADGVLGLLETIAAQPIQATDLPGTPGG